MLFGSIPRSVSIALTSALMATALLASAARSETTAASTSCALPRKPYAGWSVRTPPVFGQRFTMLSAYRLEPYSEIYLTNALSDMARHKVAGIVYTALGQITGFLQAKGSNDDEISYNRTLYRMAREAGAGIWLQLRAFGNRLTLPDAGVRTLTAEEILTQPAARSAFRQQVGREFAAYNESFAGNCVVIVFEEAGIYHRPDGGGRFWSSMPEQIRRRTAHYDHVFAERMAGLFGIVRREIKSQNPGCRVGVHLGHSTFIHPEPLENAIAGLRKAGEAPDFVFYDFYLKAQRSWEDYAAKLTERKSIITERLRLPAMHLAQLHTMNAFQHGGGRTPSRAELDDMVELSRSLAFAGYGYYTKNALPTRNVSNDPMAPNQKGQSTVYESSRDRWDYGMLRLLEGSGIDFRNRFDLVLYGQLRGTARLSLKENGSGAWRTIGLLGGGARSALDEVFVFRALEAERYMAGGRQLEARLEASRPGALSGLLRQAHIVPTEPAARFRTIDEIGRRVIDRRLLADSAGYELRERQLGGDETNLSLCIGSPLH